MIEAACGGYRERVCGWGRHNVPRCSCIPPRAPCSRADAGCVAGMPILDVHPKRVCTPNSVCPARAGEAAIYLGARSLVPSSSLPGAGRLHEEAGSRCRDHWKRAASSDALFGLAPRGVCTAAPVTRCAVSSYLTISPLPRSPACRTIEAVSFLLHFPSPLRPACADRIGRPAVNWHAALWSSDVPPPALNAGSDCPTHSG